MLIYVLMHGVWYYGLWCIMHQPPRRSELEIKKSHAFLGLSPMSVTATFR